MSNSLTESPGWATTLPVEMVAAIGGGFLSFFATFGAIAPLTVQMIVAMLRQRLKIAVLQKRLRPNVASMRASL